MWFEKIRNPGPCGQFFDVLIRYFPFFNSSFLSGFFAPTRFGTKTFFFFFHDFAETQSRLETLLNPFAVLDRARL